MQKSLDTKYRILKTTYGDGSINFKVQYKLIPKTLIDIFRSFKTHNQCFLTLEKAQEVIENSIKRDNEKIIIKKEILK